MNSEPKFAGSPEQEGEFDWEAEVERLQMAEKYERQSRIFDATLSSIIDFVYIFDCDGRFLYVNKPLLALWGLTLEEAIGKNFFDLEYPDKLATKLQSQIQQVIETGERLSDETPYKSPSGKEGYYEYIFSPVLAEDGSVDAVAGSTRDITERKRREMAYAFLAEIQKILAALSAPAEILQSAAGRIAERMGLAHCLLVEINETADEATVLEDSGTGDGRSMAGVYRISDFHTEAERRQMAAGSTILIDDVRHDPRPAENAARFAELGIGAIANASYVADGRWKFVLSAQKSEPHTWTRDEAELLSELAARVYLRLECARAEESLRESEERFRGTFENAGIGIAHLGLDGCWLRMNEAVCEITGYSREELAVRTYNDITHPDDLDADFALAQRMLSGEIRTCSLEKRYIRKDGSRVWTNMTVSLLRNASGVPLNFIAAIEDITEKKAAKEAAEAANRSKDRFLAVLSHELRTPLAPILMTATELRGDQRLPESVREQLGMIERNVALEARLIDDLLDLTKIVNGKLTVRSELCDAHSLIGLVVEMVRNDAEAKRISIYLDLTAPQYHLMGDSARLQQVFWNLLRNAVKFSNAGGRVRVRSLNGQRAGLQKEPSICIEVSDEGIGFEPEMANVIFQPFEQGASGHQFGGLGLGLAIARAVVDIHGGRMRAESTGTGKGATFTVELPGATVALAGKVAASEHPEEPDNAGGEAPMRLLLVEDHEPTMQVLARLLTRAGHHAVGTKSLAEARAAAAKEAFDLVISDLGLPDGTGIDLMQELHDAYGLRGIALSGYGTNEDMRRSEAAGFVTHLVKPIDFNDLRRALLKLGTAR